MSPYAHGKKEHVITFEEVKQKVVDACLSISDEAYFWLLYYCGVRKSEAYERVVEDFEVTDTHIIIDFHKRKKGSAEVDPLEIPLRWCGVDKIVDCVRKAKVFSPRFKKVFVYEPTGEMRVTKKGVVPIKERVGKNVLAKWVFPHIQSTKAWEIVRKVLGEGYYPHFLRLNRLTIIGSDPTASFTRLKSFSGIKSVRSMEKYLGVSKKEQRKAIEFMDREYS